MGLQHFYDKGLLPLLWAVAWTARGKMTLNGPPNHLNYCVIFIAQTKFANVAAVRITQPRGPRVGDSCNRKLTRMNSEWPSMAKVS